MAAPTVPAAPTAKPGTPRLVAPAAPERGLLRVVMIGHVDHGKSTLVGRLFHDTGSLPEGRAEAIREMCRKRGMPFEWAFLTDALQGERDQGVTIDTAHIWLRRPERDLVILDAPGHHEFLRNMVTGAASADAAALLIDAAEGVAEQTLRHGLLIELLGLTEIVVAVNKMDRVGYGEAAFAAIETEIRAYLGRLGLTPRAVVPVSAREGDNVVARSERMAWYKGPAFLTALDGVPAPAPPADLPLRIAVQDVYKFDDRRIVAGRVESGVLAAGDTLLFSPSNKTATVAALQAWPGTAASAGAGEAVGFTLAEPLFVERGEIASHVTEPPVESNVFRARLFWLGRAAMVPERTYTLKLNTARSPVQLQSVERVVEIADLSAAGADAVAPNSVAEVVLRSRAILAFDPYSDNPATGRFVLADGPEIVGGGTISMEGYPDQRASITVRSSNLTAVAAAVDAPARWRRNGHRGGVVWLTGLSGAGKSTLAQAAEKALFARGFQAYVLDGDNVRLGLNANLGFSPEDRSENIRRIGEAAALFADAGMIVLTAFISPYRADRERARAAALRVIGGDGFHEIFVKAGVEACEARDPKGLYARARTGEIAEFTGVSAPYEPPEAPDLVVDTEHQGVDACVAQIIDYLETGFAIDGTGNG